MKVLDDLVGDMLFFFEKLESNINRVPTMYFSSDFRRHESLPRNSNFCVVSDLITSCSGQES